MVHLTIERSQKQTLAKSKSRLTLGRVHVYKKKSDLLVRAIKQFFGVCVFVCVEYIVLHLK